MKNKWNIRDIIICKKTYNSIDIFSGKLTDDFIKGHKYEIIDIVKHDDIEIIYVRDETAVGTLPLDEFVFNDENFKLYNMECIFFTKNDLRNEIINRL